MRIKDRANYRGLLVMDLLPNYVHSNHEKCCDSNHCKKKKGFSGDSLLGLTDDIHEQPRRGKDQDNYSQNTVH